MENGNQKNIISKILKRINDNHNLSQSQQQTEATGIQEEKISTSINLLCTKGVSENYSIYSNLTK